VSAYRGFGDAEAALRGAHPVVLGGWGVAPRAASLFGVRSSPTTDASSSWGATLARAPSREPGLNVVPRRLSSIAPQKSHGAPRQSRDVARWRKRPFAPVGNDTQ
jgi:hypothetical protein